MPQTHIEIPVGKLVQRVDMAQLRELQARVCSHRNLAMSDDDIRILDACLSYAVTNAPATVK